MIKVQSNFCEVFGRDRYGKLDILFSAYNCSNSLLLETAKQFESLGFTDVEALRGGEPI